VAAVNSHHVSYFGSVSANDGRRRFRLRCVQRFQLHDLDDAYGLAASIVRRSSIPRQDHEDAIAYLVETVWKLSLGYEPRQAASRFGLYARRLLALRLVDGQRQRYGRTRQWRGDRGLVECPRRQHDLSLDGGDGRLAAALATSDSDPATDCDPDLVRLLRDGGDSRGRHGGTHHPRILGTLVTGAPWRNARSRLAAKGGTPRVGLEPTTLRLTAGCSAN
jgi:hypothetical protein